VRAVVRPFARIISQVSQSHSPALDGQLVTDVMLRSPKTLPADTTVEQVRVLLRNPSVQMVLLADGDALHGAITELPDDAPADAAALTFADPNPESIAASESAQMAFEVTARNPHRRVVVIDERRALVGLVCLDETRTRFCGGASSRPTSR
jgi:CBS-domain-containing membrane protein